MEDKAFRAKLKEAQKGSAEAFGTVYAEYAADLYRFALWYMKNEDDAADAVQEACLHAFQNVRKLKNADSFRSWFFKILSNTCKTMLSRQGRLSLVSLDDEENGIDPPAAPSDAGAEEILSLLEEPDRQIVAMAVLGGFTSKEIARQLNMKPGTVRSRLSRALHGLREQLAV